MSLNDNNESLLKSFFSHNHIKNHESLKKDLFLVGDISMEGFLQNEQSVLFGGMVRSFKFLCNCSYSHCL